MNFGNNLIYYRKKLGITQEELADKLFVSRQTVSRWETDSTFPDIETLIKLCDLFECDLDTLIRGNVQEENKSDRKQTDAKTLEIYDKYMNRFSLKISIGVWLIFFGASLLIALLTVNTAIAVAALLLSIGFALGAFITTALPHAEFIRRAPFVPPYPEEKTRSYTKKFSFLLSLAIFLIISGVVLLIFMLRGNVPNAFSFEQWRLLWVSAFVCILYVGIFIIVFSGMILAKYNTDEFNKGAKEHAQQSKEYKHAIGNKPTKTVDAICAAIMISAIIAFLILGFLFDLWHPGWIVFPIGGLLCGICSVIAEAKSNNNKKD